MSQDKEFPKELPEIEKYLLKKTDEAFQPFIDWVSKVSEFIEGDSKILEVLTNLLKDRAVDKVSTTRELRVIVASITMVQLEQVQMMKLLRKMVNELKWAGYYAAYLPIDAMLTMSKAIPEHSLPFKERLDTLEKEFKERKEVEIKVPENVQKELKEWAQERERMKKALNPLST